MDIPKARIINTFDITENLTAKHYESGTLDVLATPHLVVMVEKMCSEFCEKFTDEGQTTVGGEISLLHKAPTPLGGMATVVCSVKERSEKKIVFSFNAFDGKGEIAEGTHTRFVIEKERFMKKAGERISPDGVLIDHSKL